MNQQTGKIDKFAEVNTEDFLDTLLSRGSGMNAAFRKLVSVTHDPLMHYIRRFVSSLEEAQEVLQEVYVGVYQSLPKFQKKSRLTTWIFGIAHHKVFDRLSDKSRKHEEFEEYKVVDSGFYHKEEKMAESTEWDMSPEKQHIVNQVKDKIPAYAQKLPAPLQAVYHLRDIEGLNGAEVAGIVRISEQAVRVRLHRARQQIVEMAKTRINTGENAEKAEIKA